MSQGSPTATNGHWKLEDAKARFSEVVRRARSEGPQHVSVRGKDAVVVMSVEQLDGLMTRANPVPLTGFLESLHLDGLDLERPHDAERPLDL